MSIVDKIISLTSQLYPTGRAFRGANGGDLAKLKGALAASEARFYDDAKSIFDSQLPDNDNFTAQDATDNERRYGLIKGASSLTRRKQAILRKLNHPGGIPARQSYLFLQRELRAAGFDVYVYENRFFVDGVWVTKSPTDYSPSYPSTNIIEHSTQYQHGYHFHGEFPFATSTFNFKVVNSIDANIDAVFDEGDNLRSTFFIGGATEGSFADVEAAREQEFRQLILRIKPVQTVGFLLINYV